MNPFQFSGDDWGPLYRKPRTVQWFPKRGEWKWPSDYRGFMGWIFAFTILTASVNLGRAILHPRSRTLLQNVLVGPMFYSAIGVASGIALWAIWKDKPWAKDWAVAASSIHILGFLRQFVIPVRPSWDYYLAELVVAVVGVVAFSWPDKKVDTPSSEPT